MATYVISDLHSHLNILKKFVSDIDKEDKIICIGDVIDKGPDGIRVLEYIMDSDQITMLLGNHEIMMLDFLEAQNRYRNSSLLDRYFLKKEYEAKGRLWQGWNSGKATYDDFMTMSEKRRNEICDYLNSLALLKNVEVNGQQFVLVHAFPYDYQENDVYYKGCGDLVNEYVWTREPYFHIEGKIVITGHTIVQYHYGKDTIETDGQWYDIDMGLAMNSSVSRLAALCLDDMSVRYYNLIDYQ